MSYFCLATTISYKGDEILRLSPLVIEIAILGFGATFGVFSYLQRKI